MRHWLLLPALLPGLLAAQSIDTSLVDLAALDTTLRFDLHYATADNFTGVVMYPVARAWLRHEAAQALVAVQADLRREGLCLLIWDAYRPLAVQRMFWSLVPDERYVADPAKGSRHNRGAAVDLTLCDSLGRPLPMPTDFDDFSAAAAADYAGDDDAVAARLRLLQEAMRSAGFRTLDSEWWHFSMPVDPVPAVPVTAAELGLVLPD